MNNGKFLCPRGCGREFKTNSAAFAHAYHCKYEPEVAAPSEPPSDGLNQSEQLIVDRLSEMVVPQIQQGIASLQERVQAGVVDSLAEVLPKMVAQQVEGMGDMIAQRIKSNPGTSALGPGNLDQLNKFLETPIGKLISQRLLAGAGKPRGNINQWRQGGQLAIKMITSNKGNPESTAAAIKEFAKPYSGKAGSDLFRAMFDVADMFKPTAPEKPPEKSTEKPFKVTPSKGSEQK